MCCISVSPFPPFPELNQMSSSLPDTCTFDQASLAEPLSVVIHASRRCGLAPSQSIPVFGVGAIGLPACALAKHTGASRVGAININPVRLAFAKRHGFADAVYCLPSPSSSSSHSFSSSSSPKANSATTNGNGTSKLSVCATASAQLPTFSEDPIKKAKDAERVEERPGRILLLLYARTDKN